MKRTDELRKIKKQKDDNFLKSLNHLEALGNESIRIGEQFNNIGTLITDIDASFSKETSITNKKDLTFLFIATGLLCTKWLLMGKFMPLDFDYNYEPTPKENRLESKEGDKLEKEEREKNDTYNEMKDEKNKSELKHRNINQIIFNPVPYDAMSIDPKGEGNLEILSNGKKIKLYSKNHHAYTFGHDPVLGWIVGTIGIISRSITVRSDIPLTYTVKEVGNLIVNTPSDFIEKIKICIESIQEDNKRLPAAVFKQSMHFLSDKYCKTGLPIPLISPEKAQELIEIGWNSVELKRALTKYAQITTKNLSIIAVQFIISLLINEIIKAIHLLMYDEKVDGDISLYQVRTRKILLTANCISSTSNILVSAGVVISTKDLVSGAKLLDIGGFIETIRRLFTDTKFISEIKREYIQEKLYDKIYNSDFNWLYE